MIRLADVGQLQVRVGLLLTSISSQGWPANFKPFGITVYSKCSAEVSSHSEFNRDDRSEEETTGDNDNEDEDEEEDEEERFTTVSQSLSHLLCTLIDCFESLDKG